MSLPPDPGGTGHPPDDPPSDAPADLPDFTSEAIAAKVVKQGVRHSMAHAIRAVEEIAHDYHLRTDNNHNRFEEYLRIKVHESERIQHFATDRQAIVFLGAPGGPVPGPHPLAQIFIKRRLPPETRRLILAHELGHILMAFKRRRAGESFPQTFGTEDEEWCTQFAQHVCMMLHYLYTQTEFQRASVFPSMDPISEEKKRHYQQIFANEIRRWEPETGRE